MLHAFQTEADVKFAIGERPVVAGEMLESKIGQSCFTHALCANFTHYGGYIGTNGRFYLARLVKFGRAVARPRLKVEKMGIIG